jgi:hypothetical protein
MNSIAANPKIGYDTGQERGQTSTDLEIHAAILPHVTQYLAKGLDLLHWWQGLEGRGGPEKRFPLERSFNRATRSFGFYGEAPISGALLPVMGNVQEMFYDQTRAPNAAGDHAAEWTASQLREFVLKYFMRISSFRQPESYLEASRPIPPPALAPFNWCSTSRRHNLGFGFEQLFFKPSGSEATQAFPGYDRAAIVDQREVGRLYDWIVLKVRIFDFNFSFSPLGQTGPQLVFNLNEESYLAVHEEFINDRDHPMPGVRGDYGIGYAFVKNPSPGPFGYGPGEFEAALELINFRVYETGYVSVRMVFISNRPNAVANVVVNPVGWSFRLANFVSQGLFSRFLQPAIQLAEYSPLQFTIDPALAYISAAALLTGSYASEMLCISMEQLEKSFLLQHFKQHYDTILGSLATWRRFPDWLDEKNLPPWVISGVGS